ncbi:MAG: macrocin O-methyltransferase, partial [Bacteroidetes bacterium]|nr:macrocin O-methyltransferase [Bacteroidota bacterium]
FYPLEDVKKNMYLTGYPKEKQIFVEGKVESTIPNIMPSKIALLRLDTDWYESTYHELVHLYPLLVTKGVLIIDDYGHWKGARMAVDKYFDSQGLDVLLHRIDYTVRTMIKN